MTFCVGEFHIMLYLIFIFVLIDALKAVLFLREENEILPVFCAFFVLFG